MIARVLRDPRYFFADHAAARTRRVNLASAKENVDENRRDDTHRSCMADAAGPCAAPPNAPPGMSLPGMGKPPKEEEHHTVKADEKAYKSALDGIQPKQSYDPWGNVREKPKASNSR